MEGNFPLPTVMFGRIIASLSLCVLLGYADSPEIYNELITAYFIFTISCVATLLSFFLNQHYSVAL